MATGTFTDEYGNTYNIPYIPEKIIGFSGIDPGAIAVTVGSNSAGGDGTIYEVNTIGNNTSNGSTSYYSIDHEELDNLLGGEDFEHYHLSEKDYEDITEFLAARRAADEAGETEFTLSENEYERIMQLLDDLYPGWTEGEEEAKFILSEDEYEKLSAILQAAYPDEEITEPVFPTAFDEEFFNEFVDEKIADYLSSHSSQPADIDTETLNAAIDERIAAALSNKCGCCSNNVNSDTLNEAIDNRIASYLNNNTLPLTNIDNEALNAAIDEKIAAALSNKCGCCSNNSNNG